MQDTEEKKKEMTHSFLFLIVSDSYENGHANPAFKLKTPQQQRKVGTRSPSTSLGCNAAALRCGIWLLFILQ